LEYDPRFSVARFQIYLRNPERQPGTFTFTSDTTLCSVPG